MHENTKLYEQAFMDYFIGNWFIWMLGREFIVRGKYGIWYDPRWGSY